MQRGAETNFSHDSGRDGEGWRAKFLHFFVKGCAGVRGGRIPLRVIVRDVFGGEGSPLTFFVRDGGGGRSGRADSPHIFSNE